MSDQIETDHFSDHIQANPSSLSAELIDIEKAADFVEHWAELFNTAISPNPFYSPSFLQASAKHLKPNEKCNLVLIWNEENKKQLVGLFPFSVKWLQNGFLSPVCELWSDSLGACTLPLMANYNPEKIWECFLLFINKHPTLPNIVFCYDIYSQSECGKAVGSLVKQGKIAQEIAEVKIRSHVLPGSSFAEYKRGWSKTRSKNLRACRRKLEALGEVTFERHLPGQKDFKKNVDEVLELEAAGWKGKDGNALLSKPSHRAFVNEFFFSKRSDNPAEINVMRLDGRLIAGLVDLSSQRRLFGVRSAYDESLSNLSPGTILDTHLIENLCDKGIYDELDSCTVGNHHISNFYLERKDVHTLYLTTDFKHGPNRMKRLNKVRAMIKSIKSRISTVLSSIRR